MAHRLQKREKTRQVQMDSYVLHDHCHLMASICLSKRERDPGMATHTYNPSNQEAEVRESRVQDHQV